MKELSLNILDIAQNSLKASATVLKLELAESSKNDRVSLRITDNGCGMDADFLKSVTDPFVTTRSTRRIGLGIPLLRQLALDTDGRFDITSQLGKGTTVYADFRMSHLDRPPLGDIASTVMSLVQSAPHVRYIYIHTTDIGRFELDTDEVMSVLGGDISLNEPEVLMWLTDYIKENLQSIEGGKI